MKKNVGQIFCLVAYLASSVACHRGERSEEILANQAKPHPPHRRQILVTPQGLPPGTYVILGEIREGGTWMRSGEGNIERLAERAQEMGADMIIDLKTGGQFSMTSAGWAEKYAEGKAVALTNPCAFNPSSVAGGYYPRDLGSGVEPSIFSKCGKMEQGPIPSETPAAPVTRAPTSPAEPPRRKPNEPTSPACNVDQILAMKTAGLSDDQIKKACGREQ